MKIGKLKKHTVKELEELSNKIEKLRNKINKQVSKVNDSFLTAADAVEEAISHVEALETEKKSKKVKEIKPNTTYVLKDKKAKKG